MDFARYVEEFHRLYLDASGLDEPQIPKLEQVISFIPQKIVILAPHPDDECLMCGFALRAQEEFGSEVMVVPFSYGSKLPRRAERKEELLQALGVLNFKLHDPRKIDSSQEELDEGQILDAFEQLTPDLVITMHLNDGHPTHVRSADLGRRALKHYVGNTKQNVILLQSEYWLSLPHPSVLVPLSSKHLARMGKALQKHVGEVSRNPYHLTLPAWAMDQVRRGSEIAKGSKANGAIFGQLYSMEKSDTLVK